MAAIETVLCPVDFSKNSELALDYALAIAKQHDARVSVMHVVPDVLADPEVFPYLSAPVLPSGETRDRAFKQLGQFVTRARRQELAADVFLEDGDVVDQVTAKANSLPADLIVVGTHGRRGFGRLLMGSVTERLLRHASRPVLSVSPHASAPPEAGPTFQRILCPVDFSPSSLRGLDLALALAGDEGSVTVLNVVEFYVDVAVGEAIAFDLEGVREQHRKQATEKLEQAVAADKRSRTKLQTEVLHSGGAYKEILRTAEKAGSDLIVMGVMGRSATDMFFFGSTTNHVVRAAGCPVLTTRAANEEAKA